MTFGLDAIAHSASGQHPNFVALHRKEENNIIFVDNN